MFKSSRQKRKPDFLMLLTIFVCLGVVLTTTVNAAEPADKGWGILVNAESGCQQAEAEWLTCSNWRQGIQDAEQGGVMAQQRAALRLSSEYLPDTGLVAYYTLSERSGNGKDDFGLRSYQADGLAGSYDTRHFGMALKQNYGSFGLSLGFEADRVDNLSEDPLIYFGISNSW